MRVVHEVASGSELAVFVLVVIATHLLPQDRLVPFQLLHPVSEEAILSVSTISRLRVTLAELQFPLHHRHRSGFIIQYLDTHLPNYYTQLNIYHLLTPTTPSPVVVLSDFPQNSLTSSSKNSRSLRSYFLFF